MARPELVVHLSRFERMFLFTGGFRTSFAFTIQSECQIVICMNKSNYMKTISNILYQCMYVVFVLINIIIITIKLRPCLTLIFLTTVSLC